ncbi:MAG TPA: hypothetical protein VMQ50_11015 [Casimicrobiaceae bacterium]|nr:hypothetical protein [Casimicrobiaceae bacterium]
MNRFAGTLGTAISIALGAASLCTAPLAAAATPIYKCFDRHLGLLYTDVPCKDGELLDLRAGEADPAAVARLDRERDLLDQSAAQRIADERRAALMRDLAVAPGPYGVSPFAQDAPLDYGYSYPSVAYLPPRERHRHPPRDQRELSQRRGAAPNPPYPIPRP